ncbi:MAG TPA: hypothetical protein VMR19_03375 [Candidatus Saccharimonadales bacterium]|jgi:hypothetical protein|nr:hypothetical protein [Candidatus Saccharimonadales bacterium]
MALEILKTLVLLILFLLICLVTFTSLGFGLLKLFKIKLQDNLEKYTLSTILGIAVFTLVSYLSVILHVRFILWVFPVFGVFLSVKYFKSIFLTHKLHFSKSDFIYFFLIIFFGIVTQVAINAPSGFNFGGNLLFWSAQGRDGMWHIALMEEMKRNIFPFFDPEYAGHILQNYHFFVDLLMSDFSRMFHFSDLDLYFRFFPVLFSLLLGLSSFAFVRYWSKSKTAGLWAMIFTYFAGSFGYIVTLIQNRTIGGETIFWMNQTPSVLGNPPQAAAFIIVTGFLSLLLKYIRSRKLPYLFLAWLLGGVTIEFKVYGGLILLGSLLVLGIYELIFKKRYQIFLLFAAVLAISSALYFPNSSGTGSFIIFQPWWFIRTMVVVNLGLLDWELRRQTYLSVGRFTSYLRVVQLEGTAFLIYLFGNLGMRAIGFVKFFKDLIKKEIKKSINVFIYTASAVAFVTPLIFLQKGVVYNSIQFSQYFLLLSGFVAAVSMGKIIKKLKNKFAKIFITFMVILLMVPTTLGLLWQFYSNKPLAKVSAVELSALSYLRTTNQDSIILTVSYNQYNAGKDGIPPVPIYDWSDTGYIPALSGRRTLISDAEQIDIMGYDAKSLLAAREEAFNDKTGSSLTAFVRNYGINYIYLNKDEDAGINYKKLNLEKVFSNTEVDVYKVNKQ